MSATDDPMDELADDHEAREAAWCWVCQRNRPVDRLGCGPHCLEGES